MSEYCHVYSGLSYDAGVLKALLQDRIEVFPGATVVIKPNWVREGHLTRKDEWDCVIANPAVIEAVLDIVLEKLEGTGRVILADCPMAQTDFPEMLKRTRIREIVEGKRTKGTPVSILDLRRVKWHMVKGLCVSMKKLPGDPLGGAAINLGDKSEFATKSQKNFYGADYDVEEVRRYHNETDNIYEVSKTVLSADIFIGIPKLKTHRFGGITVAMKNIVGTCTWKNSLPHHTMGSPADGGDAYPTGTVNSKIETGLLSLLRRLLKSRNPLISYPLVPFKLLYSALFGYSGRNATRYGEWYGNDTIWRTILDLNKILLYADKEGRMQDTQQRKYYSVVDGICAGERNGPLSPDRKECGVVIVGENPVAVDTVAATLMGFDYRRIPTVARGYNTLGWPLARFGAEDIVLVSDDPRFQGRKIHEIGRKDSYGFLPHDGWVGHIELADTQA